MTKWQLAFIRDFSDLPVKLDHPLAPFTYFKIGGPAELYLTLDNEEVTGKVLKWATHNGCPLTILGGASNVIVADEGVSGLVLHSVTNQVEILGQSVVADAGCKTALLVSQTVQAGLTGLEYFLGVPGTLGGAVFNNAHYLKHLIAECITQVKVINTQGESYWLAAEACDFEYDHSRFQQSQELIRQVKFELAKGELSRSQELIKEATEYRAHTQPLGEPSSGCIFQNAPNTDALRQQFPQFAERSQVPGGFLIDQAGLKGRKVGNVEVSHKHAAFIVNKGGGTAADVKALIQIIKDTVDDKFGVHLQEEVFYLGK